MAKPVPASQEFKLPPKPVIEPSINFKPLNKYVLLKPDPKETEKNGIILPDASRRAPFSGRLVARADSAMPELTMGCRVYFSQIGVGYISINDVTYVMMTDEAVLGYDAPLDVKNGLLASDVAGVSESLTEVNEKPAIRMHDGKVIQHESN